MSQYDGRSSLQKVLKCAFVMSWGIHASSAIYSNKIKKKTFPALGKIRSGGLSKYSTNRMPETTLKWVTSFSETSFIFQTGESSILKVSS